MVCRGGRLVALVVGTSLVAACSGGGGEAEGSPGPSSPSSESSSESPAPPVPVMPEEARGDDDAAAVAFVEHWVELVNYAAFSGDVSELELVTEPGCEVCQSLYATMEDQPLSSADGAWSTPGLTARESSPNDPAMSDFVVEGDIDISGSESSPFGSIALGLTREVDGWSVMWLLTEQY